MVCGLLFCDHILTSNPRDNMLNQRVDHKVAIWQNDHRAVLKKTGSFNRGAVVSTIPSQQQGQGIEHLA